jgi:hypothetical protein
MPKGITITAKSASRRSAISRMRIP